MKTPGTESTQALYRKEESQLEERNFGEGQETGNRDQGTGNITRSFAPIRLTFQTLLEAVNLAVARGVLYSNAKML